MSQNSVAVAPGRTAWTRTPLSAELMLQRLAERQHERFAAAIDAVERLGRDRHDRGDIDDGAAAARDEAGHRGVGQPGERADIEADHLIHLLDVGIEQRRRGADAGIVHQQRDARVGAQRRLDPGQIRLVVEVGCDRLDRPAGLAFQALRPTPRAGSRCGRPGSGRSRAWPGGRHRSRRSRRKRR